MKDKKIFVNQLGAGQSFAEVFLVSRKTLAETKAGKPYLALALMDRSGEIEARIWDNALHFDALAEEGGYVEVQAVAKPFRDQLQLVVNELSPVSPERLRLSDFLPASNRPLDEMAAELAAVIGAIALPSLRALLENIFQGETLERFQRAPAAKKLHHAYIGGLIEHTLSIVGMARRAADHYPLIDRDLLIAGALLHDLAKIEEFDYSSPAFSYTDRGRLVGHLVMGTEMVRRAADLVPGISSELVDQVLHIILSHHGQYAYGSPVLPMTPEAILLHHLDDIDAKMNSMDGLRAKMEPGRLQWTDYQRHLERYLFLRGSGPSEMPVAPDEGEPESPRSGQPRAGRAAKADNRQPTLF